jgi:ATP-dependent RNA helicase DeaD
VGRRNNADPRWLLPIICRLGHVTKKEIGPIRIFDRETKFGIVKSHASKFASAARKTNDEDIRIEPAEFDRAEDRDGKKVASKDKKGKKFPPPGKKPNAVHHAKRKG